MTIRLLTVPASLLCLSLGLDLGAVLVIPTFIPGCEQFPPRVTSHYLLPGKPIARDPFAQVPVFLRGDQPTRRYVVIGDIEVLTRGRNTSLGNMIEYASREARKMGGEAILDVWPRPVEDAKASADRRGRHVLTAKVVRWRLAQG